MLSLPLGEPVLHPVLEHDPGLLAPTRCAEPRHREEVSELQPFPPLRQKVAGCECLDPGSGDAFDLSERVLDLWAAFPSSMSIE